MIESELEPIAIVGLAVRVPGADTPEQLWHNLRTGVESVARFSRDELRVRGVPEHVRAHPHDDPADIAFTLHVGRRALAHRVAFGFRDRGGLIAALSGDLRDASEVDADRAPPVIFVFPDGDAWQLAPLVGSLRREGAFRDAYDECARAARGALSDAANLVAIQLALARTWKAWGVEPAGVRGLGRGAHAAAVVSGTLPLADAIARADLPGGSPDALPDGAIVLEIGLGGPHACGASSSTWISALAGSGVYGAPRAMITAAARLWRLGVAIDPAGLYRHERRQRIALPTYPFDGARFGWRVTRGHR